MLPRLRGHGSRSIPVQIACSDKYTVYRSRKIPGRILPVTPCARTVMCSRETNNRVRVLTSLYMSRYTFTRGGGWNVDSGCTSSILLLKMATWFHTSSVVAVLCETIWCPLDVRTILHYKICQGYSPHTDEAVVTVCYHFREARPKRA